MNNLNLLENALEACIEDTTKLSYNIEFNVRGDRNDILLDIADNGSSIKKELIKQMFTLFYSSKGHKGTGFSL